LYSRCTIVLLDDCLGALDPKTRQHVVEKLLSKDGHAKSFGITVILATHISSVVEYADELLVLADSGGQDYYGVPQDWSKFADSVSLAADEEDESTKTEADKSNPRNSTIVETLEDHIDELDELQKFDPSQTGDLTVWSYYFGKIGAPKLILAVFLILLTCFASQFPSKLFSFLAIYHTYLVLRTLDQNQYRKRK